MNQENENENENENEQENNNKIEKKKHKSLFDPTESMLSSQREYERRKNEIKPEDDPFWEKRGGKCSKIISNKFHDLPEKPQKTLKECLEQMTPLPNNSRLLTPTQATLLSVYHKENIIKEKHITILPNNSHLLTPTKASTMGEYHPHSPSLSPRDKSSNIKTNYGDDSFSPSQNNNNNNNNNNNHYNNTHQVNSRLLELTANRKSAAYEKKIIDNDPREDGWRPFFSTNDPKSPLPPPPELPINNTYKDVKSKLYNPTVASVRQKWSGDLHSQNYESIETNDLIEGEIIEDDHHHHHTKDIHNTSSPTSSSSYNNNHKKFTEIHSRLYQPTAAVLASQWCNRPTSTSISPPRQNRRQSSGEISIPSVHGKTTQAQIHGQRVKYIKPDDGDIAKKEDIRGRNKNSRSKSVPIAGRIYNPPPPPPMTERRSSIRRSIVSSPVTPATQYYSNLVGNQIIDTPIAKNKISEKKRKSKGERKNKGNNLNKTQTHENNNNNGDNDHDDNNNNSQLEEEKLNSEVNHDAEYEREGRLSRLFTAAVKEVEIVEEKTNPMLLSRETSEITVSDHEDNNEIDDNKNNDNKIDNDNHSEINDHHEDERNNELQSNNNQEPEESFILEKVEQLVNEKVLNEIDKYNENNEIEIDNKEESDKEERQEEEKEEENDDNNKNIIENEVEKNEIIA